jgi:Gram-negative bacterial TonB protein C-terminal
MKLRVLLLSTFLLIHTYSVAQEQDSIEEEDFCISQPSPSFPGGADSLKLFIKRNLKKPEGHHVGKVFIQFIIDKDGYPTDFRVIKGLCQQCDENALEVLKKMPKWIHHPYVEKPRKMKLIVPIVFN